MMLSTGLSFYRFLLALSGVVFIFTSCIVFCEESKSAAGTGDPAFHQDLSDDTWPWAAAPPVSPARRKSQNTKYWETYRDRSPSTTISPKSRTLYIGGIFPMSGGWAGGKGCRPAVDMALEDINRRVDILPEFKLEMLANDTRCLPGLGMKVLYELVYNDPVKLMILGPGCSIVSTFVGQAAKMWNLVVLSYGSSSPALSDRDRFTTFFRTHPSATLHNPTRIKLFKKFGWTRIATIQETQEVFTSTMEDLEERAQLAGIEIAVRTNFLNSPENAVRNLKRQDARIIVGLFYEDKARRVFCEAYKQKLYGPKHVWFIIGWYADNWFMEPDTNCTVEQMQEVLEGHFTTEGLMLNQDKHQKSISQMTAGDFTRNIQQRIQQEPYGREVNPLSVTGYVEAPLAYDAVWALALALNKTQARLKSQEMSLEDFDYSNKKIMDEIYRAMNATNFIGVSGHVAFNAKGDRIALTQIEQMWNGSYTKIGFYNATSDNLTWFDNEKWLDGKKPEDRTTVEPILRVVSPSLYICFCLLASVGIVACFLLLVFLSTHRSSSVIALSQPQMNLILLIGCIAGFSCIFLNGLDSKFISEQATPTLCQIRAWILCIAFTLSYGSMFSKIWTIYRLTTRRKRDLQVVRQCEMYAVLCVFLAIDIILMVSWQLINPFYRDLESFPREKPAATDRDIEYLPQLEHCRSQNMYIWFGVVFGYKGVLLLFGILLVYETHNVKLNQINDSRFVGMSMCNIVVLCAITVPVALIIESHQDATFTFTSVSILLCNFLAMGLIFTPKIRSVFENAQPDSQDIATLTDNEKTNVEEEQCSRLQQENDSLRIQIAEKEEKIRQLHCQLQRKIAAQVSPVSQQSF